MPDSIAAAIKRAAFMRSIGQLLSVAVPGGHVFFDPGGLAASFSKAPLQIRIGRPASLTPLCPPVDFPEQEAMGRLSE